MADTLHLRNPLPLLTAALTLLLAAALIFQCLALYQVGASPANLDSYGAHITPVYSRANVGERLHALWPLAAVYALVILVAAAFSRPTPAMKLALTPENRLRLMRSRVAALPAGALYEERLRRVVRLCAGAALVGCAIPAGAFLLDRGQFSGTSPEAVEAAMGRMLLHVGPFVALGLALLAGAVLLCDRSMLRECEILKSAPKTSAGPRQEGRFPVGVVRAVLYAAAIAFIVLGVMNGGLRDVLIKATNICTECIGLG